MKDTQECCHRKSWKFLTKIRPLFHGGITPFLIPQRGSPSTELNRAVKRKSNGIMSACFYEKNICGVINS